jgi:Pentapeptide repeats (9 copies)
MISTVSRSLVAKSDGRVVGLAAIGLPAAADVEDGYTDLRGFPLHKMSDVIAGQLDFSYAKSPDNEHGMDSLAFLVECHLQHCRFCGAGKFHGIHGEFVDCDFSRIQARGVAMTGRFVDCSFSRADLTSAAAPNTFFRRCRFHSTKLTRVHFGGCVFEECDFRETKWSFGSVCGANFRACDLTNVDFEDAVRDEATLFDHKCKTDGMRFDDEVTVYGVRVYTGTDGTLLAENDAELKRSAKRRRTRRSRS